MTAAATARRTLPTDAPLVRIEGLVKHYALRRGVVKALDGVSLTINEGEVLGLVGESGCGKSTVARVVTRLTGAGAGAVWLDGQDMLTLRGRALRRMRTAVQLVFQDPCAALDPQMTIGRSMLAPLVQNGFGDRAAMRAPVLRMLDEVGLDASFFDRYPAQCSGGQLQRVVIGRALLLRPWFLVCDEPTSALDASMRTQVLNLLVDLRDRLSLTLLVISHDLRVVRFLCDRIAVMYLGQVVETAPRDALFARPRHPYTRALIASSMIETTGLGAVDVLTGDPPSPLDPPAGCRLHARCRFATGICARETPALAPVGPGHDVRCHHAHALDLSEAGYATTLARAAVRTESTTFEARPRPPRER